MKPSIFLALFATLLPSGLAATCIPLAIYCGESLTKEGWSVDALKEAIERNTSLPPEARTHPGKVIFSCDANGQAIDAGEYCYYSCLELEGGFAVCTYPEV